MMTPQPDEHKPGATVAQAQAAPMTCSPEACLQKGGVGQQREGHGAGVLATCEQADPALMFAHRKMLGRRRQ